MLIGALHTMKTIQQPISRSYNLRNRTIQAPNLQKPKLTQA